MAASEEQVHGSPPVTRPAPPLETAQVFSSVRWLAVGHVATQAGRLLVSVVLARLLEPADFGILTMASVFTVFATLFSTLGAGPVIVQRPQLSERLLRSLATLGLGMGLAITVGLVVAAFPIAAFYREPPVTWIVMALGTTFLVTSLGVVPEGLLQREMRFSRLVSIDFLQLVVGSSTSVILAVRGMGVWALVIGSIVANTVRSAALVTSSPWRMRFGFDAAEVRGIVGFSAGVMGANVVNYLARYTDRLVIGRLLGATQLGYYDYAYRFYVYPQEAITSVLIRIMFPTFSRMQNDPGQLGRAFLRANGAIALITFPMMIGLAAVADPFVRVVLGDRWAPIIPLVQILAPVAMLSSLAATPGQLFLALGRAGLRFWWAVGYTSAIVVAILCGVPWGVQGIALAFGAVMVPINIVAFWLAMHLVGLPLKSVWVVLRLTFAAGVGMGAAVTVLRLGLTTSGVPQVVVLTVSVLFGVVVYLALARWLRPDALDDLYRLLPEAARRRASVSWLLSRRQPT